MIASLAMQVLPALWVAMFLGAAVPIPSARNLPPLVFVSRAAPPGLGSAVPGFGPYGRAMVTRGTLMVRRPNGQVKPLLPPETFLDVSDPSVSWDGRSIAFAATASPDSGWRIYVVGADGHDLAAVTRTDRNIDVAALGPNAERLARYDDIDPCWLPDGRIVFASTRFPQIAQQGGLPVTNLFAVRRDGSDLQRITSERNGAEEPTVDLETGRIIYSRWWFNRFLASDETAIGITTDRKRAVPADPVDLWQAVSIMPDGDRLMLAGGNPRVRSETMIYQPVLLANGTLVGVGAERTSLAPDGGTLEIRIFKNRFARPQPLFEGARGSACAPVELPGGRVLFSYDPEGKGDFGLYAVRPGGRRLERVLDLPGYLELDAAVLRPRKRPPRLPAAMMALPGQLPVTERRVLEETGTTFRFDCLNVFTNAAVDAPIPDAPALQRDLRIRFFATLARPGNAAGDTVVLLREQALDPSGAVHAGELPADVPMFEQLVDAHGKVLRSVSGPAHVPGQNAGRFGSGTKCVGCHTGHSVIDVAPSASQGKWFNAATSARVSASSVAEGFSVRAVVDRRARGPSEEVAWVARSAHDETLRLAWDYAIDVQRVILYALNPSHSEGTDLRVLECELVFVRGDREVHRETVRRAISPEGTRINIRSITVDAIEVRLLRASGKVRGRAVVGLAEIETIAKLAEE